jgi:uncharacterized protein (DUF1015 family)
MVAIHAFRGITPSVADAAAVVALPYDTMSHAEARAQILQNEKSFLRIEKSDAEFADPKAVSPTVIHEKAKANLERFLKKGWLVQSDIPCLYFYQQVMSGRTQTGLVAATSVFEYDAGLIKKHEHTRADKEEERTLHVDIVNANTGPVFLTYRSLPAMKAITAELTRRKPDIDVMAEDGITHRLWCIADPTEIARIEHVFGSVEALYIADGHHRSKAASWVAERRRARGKMSGGHDYFLSVIFPDDELAIMDYNRVVKDLNGMTPDTFLGRLQSEFEAIPVANAQAARPTQRRQFAMLLDHQWYRLTLKAGVTLPADAVGQLDVAILQDRVLAPILGIQNPRTDQRIDFVGGIRGYGELEKRCRTDAVVAFGLYPTGLDQLMAIADAGAVMPPKSTWFEPKLRSGMVVRPLERP